jgi:hypothetical protein
MLIQNHARDLFAFGAGIIAPNDDLEPLDQYLATFLPGPSSYNVTSVDVTDAGDQRRDIQFESALQPALVPSEEGDAIKDPHVRDPTPDLIPSGPTANRRASSSPDSLADSESFKHQKVSTHCT